jgi:uncharacterized protein YbaP (TraB family)
LYHRVLALQAALPFFGGREMTHKPNRSRDLRNMLLAVVSLVASCGVSFSKAWAQSDAAPTDAASQPALWVVRDADSTIYLFGTMHLLKEGALWGGPAAQAALAQAQEVWTEIEVDPANEGPKMLALIKQYGVDTQRPLSSRIDPNRRPAYEAALKSIGSTPTNFDSMKPWLASITLSMIPSMRGGYQPDFGVENRIDAVAESAGKSMRWFETAAEQLRFFADLSESTQLQLLYDAIDALDEGPAALAELDAAWASGDIASLERLVIDDMRANYPELYEALITRRNERWADVLAKELEGSGVDFVAVGAGHLVGPESVQAFLALKGISAVRLAP